MLRDKPHCEQSSLWKSSRTGLRDIPLCHLEATSVPTFAFHFLCIVWQNCPQYAQIHSQVTSDFPHYREACHLPQSAETRHRDAQGDTGKTEPARMASSRLPSTRDPEQDAAILTAISDHAHLWKASCASHTLVIIFHQENRRQTMRLPSLQSIN